MSLVIFDLDNTLIKGQSQNYLIFYLYKIGWLPFSSLMIIFLWFVGYKMNICKNPKWALEKALSSISGKRIDYANEELLNFYNLILKSKYNSGVVEILKKHLINNDEVVLVSNTVAPLAQIVAGNLGIKKVFATNLEDVDGMYTGKIKGDIVYGENKAKIVKNNFAGKLENSIAYADHCSDIFLMKIVSCPFLVKPTKCNLNYYKNNFDKKIDIIN